MASYDNSNFQLDSRMREIIYYLNNMSIFEKTVFVWFGLMCMIALTTFRYYLKKPSDINIYFITFTTTGLVITVGCVIGYLCGCLI